MRRKSIDKRRISSRRPDLSLNQEISASLFAESVETFSADYLKGALTVSVEGASTFPVKVSLHDFAYALRLIVELGGKDALLESKISISKYLSVEVSFPYLLPSINQLTDIARAVRVAGFVFELRDRSIIMRTVLDQTSGLPVFSEDIQDIISIFAKTFFEC